MLVSKKKCPPAGSVVARRLTVCLCDQNAEIFEVRMNLCESYAVILRSLQMLNSDPTWSDVVGGMKKS